MVLARSIHGFVHFAGEQKIKLNETYKKVATGTHLNEKLMYNIIHDRMLPAIAGNTI